MIKVVNKYAMPKIVFGDLVVYIGRGSALGNKFKISKSKSRVKVIKEYRIWLWNILKDMGEARFGNNSGPVVNEIQRLAEADKAGRNIYLECFCSPKACHGDIVINAVRWFQKEFLK